MAVDAKLLKQLKDKDPTVRRKVIVALANYKDDISGALDVLADVARSDGDEKLRNLATRAQTHLKEQMERQQPASTPEAQPSHDADTVKVSEKDQARGKAATEEALSYYIAKDLSKATLALMKALKANPNLKSDSYFLSLAGDVLNADHDEAIKILQDSSRRGEYVNSSRKTMKQKKKDQHYSKTDELPWSAVWFDLGVFAAVTAVISFLTPLVTAQMITRMIAYQMGLSPEKLAEESVLVSREVSDLVAAINTVNLPILLAVALGTAAAAVVSMLVQGGIVHVVATKLLRGVGTMRYTMCQILPFYSMTTGIVFIWWCVAMGIMAAGAGMIGMLCMAPMALVTLFRFLKLAGKVGGAYDFGTGKGCLSIILASIILGLLASLPGAAVYGAFQSWLQGALLMS